MKVFVVEYFDVYEGFCVAGVFSARTLAEEYIAGRPDEQTASGGHEIQEWEVIGPEPAAEVADEFECVPLITQVKLRLTDNAE